MSKRPPVTRPLKRSEYTIEFITSQAEKGWVDFLATARNATVDAWDFLTATPTLESARVYRLKADLATGAYGGETYDRYQYKVTNGGRIWYFVVPPAKGEKTSAGKVLIERCSTAHPNDTA